MKKWLLISALTLGLICGGAGVTSSHIDEASTEPTVRVPAKLNTKAKASGKVNKPVSVKTKAAVPTAKPKAVKAAQAASSSASAKHQSTASQSVSTKPTVQQATGLAAYYGTWHNQAVTISLTNKTLTLTQTGQPSITTAYRATANGDGYLFTPTGIEADPLQLVLHNGHLAWVTGASAPLMLER